MEEKKIKPFVVVVMGGDQAELTTLSIRSVLSWADKIIYLDGGSKDDTLLRISQLNDERITVLQRYYEKDNPKGNGQERNYYLSYLKERYDGSWCLALDSDEVVCEKGYLLKDFVAGLPADSPEVFSVHMRHFVGNLGEEDATVEKHFVPHRLFKVGEGLSYPEVEHPVLQGREKVGAVDFFTIWHFAYAKNMLGIRQRFLEHTAKSNMHTPEQLKKWAFLHLTGTYPTRPVRVEELPPIIRGYFGI